MNLAWGVADSYPNKGRMLIEPFRGSTPGLHKVFKANYFHSHRIHSWGCHYQLNDIAHKH